MKRTVVLFILGAVGCFAAVAPAGATGGLQAGFGVRKITAHVSNEEAAGWGFSASPSGIWGEPFTDRNGNGYYDLGEPFLDDVRNTQIDPQSAGEWDGCWANAGFGGKGATGMYDDVWARATVLRAGGKTVALVSLDVVGFFYEEIERVRAEYAAAHPDAPIDMIVVSSTHTHEGCDTMGYWGIVDRQELPPEADGTPLEGNDGLLVSDGKHPLYQKFVRAQIASAIYEAATTAEPVKMKAATTVHTAGIRDSRNPNVIDPYLQAAQFVRADESVVGTIVNWSNHPEALAGNNRKISSDFPHGTRTTIEAATGAPAIYFSGSVGGLMTPLRVDMGPGYGTGESLARAYYIGELVADAALAALETAPAEEVDELGVAAKDVYLPADNLALRTLNVLGIFDKPTFVRAGDAFVPAGILGDEFKTQVVAIKAGSVRFQTVPGELFPELELGGYGRTDCTPEEAAAADTGRPYEPVIAEQWEEEHLFTLGLAQDELGYIVPGYDFWMFGAPNQDAPRPLIDVGALEATDPCGEDHYEETVSGSSVMAPLVTCTIAELAGRDPWSAGTGYEACSAENTTVAPQGLHLPN